MSQLTTHAPHIFPYMVLECCHNIRNQFVSTEIPSPNSFCDIISIGTHQHLGKILKDIFYFFKTVWRLNRPSTQTNIILFLLSIAFHSYTQELVCIFHSNKFFLFIINLRILSFSQDGFNLRSIQILKYLALPKICPPHPPTTQPFFSRLSLVRSQHS